MTEIGNWTRTFDSPNGLCCPLRLSLKISFEYYMNQKFIFINQHDLCLIFCSRIETCLEFFSALGSIINIILPQISRAPKKMLCVFSAPLFIYIWILLFISCEVYWTNRTPNFLFNIKMGTPVLFEISSGRFYWLNQQSPCTKKYIAQQQKLEPLPLTFTEFYF